MAEKDVDEQFAAIMAHWDDVALGLDPYGDPHPDSDPTREPPAAPPADASTRLPEIRRIRDVDDLPDVEEARRDDRLRDVPVEVPSPDPQDADDQWDDDEPDESVWAHDDDPEQHYSPPPPAPLPSSEDKHFWLMVVALVSGPLLFLYLLLFNRDGNGWWMLFALMVSIAGFVLLVLRQPLDRDEDDDGIRL
jgi:hypothetical protein